MSRPKLAPYVANGFDYFEAALAYNKQESDLEAITLLKSNVFSRKLITNQHKRLLGYSDDLQTFLGDYLTISAKQCGHCLNLNKLYDDYESAVQTLQAMLTVIQQGQKF